MHTISTNIIYASVVIMALVVPTFLWAQRRRGHDVRERPHQFRGMQAWTELQQLCIALVEEDERGGADAEELHRAVARYRIAAGDRAGVRINAPPMKTPKQAPLLY